MNLANPFLENISPAGLLANQSIKKRQAKQLEFQQKQKERLDAIIHRMEMRSPSKTKTIKPLPRRSIKPVLKQLPNVIDKTLDYLEQNRRTAYIARNQTVLDICDAAINAIAIMRTDADRLDKAQDLKMFGAFEDIRQKIDEVAL